MTALVLLTNQTAVQNYPPQMFAAQKPDGTAPATQGFSFNLNGVGSCSATVQPYAACAGESPGPYGPPIYVSGNSVDLSPTTQLAQGNSPFTSFGCLVTSISGTSASITARMSF